MLVIPTLSGRSRCRAHAQSLALPLGHSTGGLNGSLVDVTSELPTLGLNGAVLSALANATYNTSGVYGYPISGAVGGGWKAASVTELGEALASPALTFGLLVDLWNSVSGVLLELGTLVVHGLEGINGFLWRTENAAAMFFDLVGLALLRYAIAFVQAAVADLGKTGQVLVGALAALLTLVENEVIALFSETFQPSIQAIQNYASSVVSDLSAIEAGGTGDATVRSFWEDAGGEVFVSLLAIATVVTVAIAVVSALSLRAGFLASQIAVILITAAILAVLTLSSTFMGGLSAWGSNAIATLESYFSNPPMYPSAASRAARPQPATPTPEAGICSWQGSWDAISTVYASLVDVFSGLTLGPGLLAGVLFGGLPGLDQNDVTGRIVDLAAGVLGVMVDVVGLGAQLHGQNDAALFLSIWGVLLGIGGFIVDQVLETHELPGAWGILDKLSDLLDLSSIGIGGGTIAADIGICGGP